MTVVLHEPWTVERFLLWEDAQEGRHEFDGTQVIALTGGSRNHQRIVGNLLRFLEDQLDPRRFDAMQEMRVNTGGQIRYPDLSVVAGRVPGTVKTLHDAVVLFEVLSDETAETDQGEKRADYARLPSLRRYVLLEQARMAATVLVRVGEKWMETQAGAILDLPELGVALPLASAYRGVQFG
jgi:Uma2 family endonuclease